MFCPSIGVPSPVDWLRCFGPWQPEDAPRLSALGDFGGELLVKECDSWKEDVDEALRCVDRMAHVGHRVELERPLLAADPGGVEDRHRVEPHRRQSGQATADAIEIGLRGDIRALRRHVKRYGPS